MRNNITVVDGCDHFRSHRLAQRPNCRHPNTLNHGLPVLVHASCSPGGAGCCGWCVRSSVSVGRRRRLFVASEESRQPRAPKGQKNPTQKEKSTAKKAYKSMSDRRSIIPFFFFFFFFPHSLLARPRSVYKTPRAGSALHCSAAVHCPLLMCVWCVHNSTHIVRK